MFRDPLAWQRRREEARRLAEQRRQREINEARAREQNLNLNPSQRGTDPSRNQTGPGGQTGTPYDGSSLDQPIGPYQPPDDPLNPNNPSINPVINPVINPGLEDPAHAFNQQLYGIHTSVGALRPRRYKSTKLKFSRQYKPRVSRHSTMIITNMRSVARPLTRSVTSAYRGGLGGNAPSNSNYMSTASNLLGYAVAAKKLYDGGQSLAFRLGEAAAGDEYLRGNPFTIAGENASATGAFRPQRPSTHRPPMDPRSRGYRTWMNAL